ncbi:hypothetical protein IV01_19220 [Pseudomonas syringae]|uniref:Uncharacterized protein n=1 Tax=Pseudomonas syringae TaxID=317 RepID=A0A085VDH6_PSESX|nr:hypothetical protein IV01_19220 [Pseudomonas syringae]
MMMAAGLGYEGKIKARSYGRNAISVGAVLARDTGDAVYQAYRVIVHREQARLLQTSAEPVGAVLARDLGDAVYQSYRVIVHREQARSDGPVGQA